MGGRWRSPPSSHFFSNYEWNSLNYETRFKSKIRKSEVLDVLKGEKMTDEIRIKFKKKASKKKVSKKAVKKTAKKISKKASKKASKKKVVQEEISEEVPALGSLEGVNLLEMDSEELDDESKRQLIRARSAQADKQNRLNQIAEGQLVERREVIEIIQKIAFGAVELLDLFPDQVGPLLHKKTQKQIREKLVQQVDKVKERFVDMLEEFEE